MAMMEKTTYKVMSFNMRNANGKDGINAFPFRDPRIREMLAAEAPDIIGFQEVVNASRDWLREVLEPTYTLVGCGRESNYRGEGVPVAFRNECFEMIGFDCFWLSPTPLIPGSVYENSDQSRYPRMVNILRLKPQEWNCPLTVINTHLDHIGKCARAMELTWLEQYISENVSGFAVLTGDFNAVPQMPEMIGFTERMKALGWTDATASFPPTFHGYCLEPSLKIDYIFTNCRWQDSRIVVDVPQNGVYYSDHQAVCTQIGLLSERTAEKVCCVKGSE